jgi:hypothetical protein
VTSLLLFATMIVGGLDVGGRIGATFPATGLRQSQSSSALVGAFAGYSVHRHRFELSYCYSGLPAPQASPYRLDIGELTASYGYEFLSTNWGMEAVLGAGMGLLERSIGSAAETGRAPEGRIGFHFLQHQGNARISLGLDNSVFVENATSGGTTVSAATWLISIRAGVAYAF